MPMSRFVIATLLGIAPGTTVFVSVGRGLDHVLAAGRTPDLQILTSPTITGPLVALGLLSLLPVVWRHLSARHGASTK